MTLRLLVLVVALTVFATLRARTALATFTAFRTRTTLATLRALTTLPTTLLRLYIVSRLLYQHTVREFELSCLGIYLQQFDSNLVASTVSSRFQSISEMCSSPSLPGMNSTKQP